MRRLFLLAVLLATPISTQAGIVKIKFAGAGVSGDIQLTYGTTPDAKYGQALEVTGISGTFTDTNNGLNIIDAAIGSLVAIKQDTPDATNLLAPKNFSRFAVATGLSPISNGFLTYDNLFWPTGSPPTASDYPAQGGFLDIYGLLFEIGGGRVVNFWSNGTFSPNGAGPISYGIAVATADQALDYVSTGVTAVIVPEPSTLMLVGMGLAGTFFRRRDLLKGRPKK